MKNLAIKELILSIKDTKIQTLGYIIKNQEPKSHKIKNELRKNT